MSIFDLIGGLMAIIIDVWQADGDGQSALCSHRVGKEGLESALARITAQWAADARCVLITYTHTSAKRTVEKITYTKPGYVDPCG